MILNIFCPISAAAEYMDPNQVKECNEIATKIKDLMIYSPDESMYECYPCSESVNTIADDILFEELKVPGTDHVQIFAWPYIQVSTSFDKENDILVYGNPPYHLIGESNIKGFGVTPIANLETKIDEIGLTARATRHIKNYLRDHPAISYLD